MVGVWNPRSLYARIAIVTIWTCNNAYTRAPGARLRIAKQKALANPSGVSLRPTAQIENEFHSLVRVCQVLNEGLIPILNWQECENARTDRYGFTPCGSRR